jgi:hypothetical protein
MASFTLRKTAQTGFPDEELDPDSDVSRRPKLAFGLVNAL